MTGMTAAAETVVMRPAGTRALLYAVLSVVAAGPAWLLGYVIGQAVGGGFVVFGLFTALAGAVVAAVVAVVQRIALDRREAVSLRRVTAWAVGVPAGVLVLGALVDALLRAI